MKLRGPLTFHVTPESGVWCLWLAGAPNTAQHFARKEDAVRLGLQHAAASPPSQLLVFDPDGRVALTRTFETQTRASVPDRSSQYALGPGSVPRDEV